MLRRSLGCLRKEFKTRIRGALVVGKEKEERVRMFITGLQDEVMEVTKHSQIKHQHAQKHRHHTQQGFG